MWEHFCLRISRKKLEETCSYKMSKFSKLFRPEFCGKNSVLYIFKPSLVCLWNYSMSGNISFQKSLEDLTIFLMRPNHYNTFLKQLIGLKMSKFVISFVKFILNIKNFLRNRKNMFLAETSKVQQSGLQSRVFKQIWLIKIFFRLTGLWSCFF